MRWLDSITTDAMNMNLGKLRETVSDSELRAISPHSATTIGMDGWGLTVKQADGTTQDRGRMRDQGHD